MKRKFFLILILPALILVSGYLIRQAIATSNPHSWTNGLVGYWAFDGQYTTSTAGTRDVSNNGNWGTFNGGVKPTAGISGQALSFDGVDDYVSIGSNNIINGGGNFFIGGWFYFKSPTGYQFLLDGRGADDQTGWVLAMDITVNKVGFLSASASGWDNTGLWDIFTPTLNTWTHIAIGRNGNDWTFYVNGIAIATTNNSNSIGQQNIPLTIGKGHVSNPALNTPFPGLIDEVRIYSRALSADEVKQHYEQTRRNLVINNPSGTPPVAWWKLDEDLAIHGSTIRDYSVNANTGTFTTNDGATNKSTDGKVGKAITFDGTDDYVDLGTQNLLPSGVGTVSVWVKFNAGAIAKNNYLITKGADWNPGAEISWGLGILPADTTSANLFLLYGAAAWVSTGDIPYSLTDWHLFTAVMKSNNTQELYLDGVLKKNGTLTTITPTASLGFTIGKQTRNDPNGYHTNGLIDDVRIYNYARTADQIAADYRTGAYRTIIGTSVPSTWWTSGLVGYWNFDGANTTSTNGTRDTSGQNNWGTFSGGVKPVGGISGQSMSFDGSDDYIGIAHNAGLNLDIITISMWVKPTSAVASMIATKRVAYNDNNEWNIYMGDDRTIRFQVTSNGNAVEASTESFTTTNIIPLNAWTHIVVQKSTTANDMKIYFDGVRQTAGTWWGVGVTSIVNGTAQISIGASNGTSLFFPGLIDEVRIYNRALSAEEVMQHYQQTRRNIGL